MWSGHYNQWEKSGQNYHELASHFNLYGVVIITILISVVSYDLE